MIQLFLILLAATTAIVAAPSPSLEDVRAEMRRQLRPSERTTYRGITMSAMTGVKFDELYNINTPEDLITAEYYGKQSVPLDDPHNIYLFSVGHGLAARYNTEYAKTILDLEDASNASAVSPKTIDEIHTEYQNMTRPATTEEKTEVEGTLEAVASDFVSWTNDGQSLRRRQQGYYCKKRGTPCASASDCPKIKTIDRKRCICGSYYSCATEPLPLPPYCPVAPVGVICP